MVSVTRLQTSERFADALVDLYVEWREECSSVHSAYERWRSALRDDSSGAFAAYNAALDREERAGNAYAALVQRVSPAARPPR